MKAFVLVSLLVLCMGCRSSLTGDEPDALAISFFSVKDVYGMEEDIIVMIENKMPDSILTSECFGVEQRRGDTWEYIGRLERCEGRFYPLGVGLESRRTLSSVGARYGEGVYRLTREVLLQEDWRQSEIVRTEAFTIVPRQRHSV